MLAALGVVDYYSRPAPAKLLTMPREKPKGLARLDDLTISLKKRYAAWCELLSKGEVVGDNLMLGRDIGFFERDVTRAKHLIPRKRFMYSYVVEQFDKRYSGLVARMPI